jgi:fumarylacetoacetate (FAA) hydrolase family protein
MKEVFEVFPADVLEEGLLVGRIWRSGSGGGPAIVLFDRHGAHDLSGLARTMSELLERHELPVFVSQVSRREPLCSLEKLIESSLLALEGERSRFPCLLAPCDLQVIKACGVTFAISALERVVEERTSGNPTLAADVRSAIGEVIGEGILRVKPGSGAAAELKERLLSLGMWSQYLEVAFGPDAEIFTKASPLASVGYGAEIGIHRMSSWNNPEPEIVLAVNSRGQAVGASLGNDVNLRDVEGRSALLLGKAKDNNGACAIGPAIRLFDGRFTLDHVRRAEVHLEVEGPEGFRLHERSSMSQISRDPLELVRQAIGPHHQYPDGLMLFLGTLFAPVQDRAGAGKGFTHVIGDRVTIRAAGFGSLLNRVNYCDAIPPWTFGIGELLRHMISAGAHAR